MFLSVPIVASTGISNFLEESAPDLAIGINPYNNDAGINLFLGSIAISNLEENLPQLQAKARQLILNAPTDARGYSLLAEAHLQAGDSDMAKRLFETALRYSKTEIHALRRTFGMLVQQGDYVAALDRLDVISRRWPERFSDAAPYIPAILTKDESYEKALDLIREDPPWRGNFFAVLNSKAANLDLAYTMQLDLKRIDGSFRPEEAGRTMQALISAKRYDLAHRLFLFTLSESEQELSGYVFNSKFAAEPSARPFDWTLRSNSSAQVYRTQEPIRSTNAVRVRFLGKPVKTVGLSQRLRLPPGMFRLTVEYSGTGLQMPKGFYLNLVCLDPRAEYARIAFPETKADHVRLQREFEVNAAACNIFQIGTGTELIAESFRYRYNGTLSFHEIRIDRSGS